MKLRPSSLRLINTLLAIGALALILLGISEYATPPASPNIPQLPEQKKPSLPRSFSEANAFDAINTSSFLSLEPIPLKPRLPDLRGQLVYYGSNHRPDTEDQSAKVQIGFRGDQNQFFVLIGTKVYIKKDPKPPLGRWILSPDNATTSTWIEVQPKNIREAQINVYTSDVDGRIIRDPIELSSFALPQMRTIQNPVNVASWEIGGYRVDNSLLARQRAQWFGKDAILEEMGDEGSDLQSKERVTFTKQDSSTYSCLVAKGDALAFYADEWHNVILGPESRNKPLLLLQEIDDRAMHFDLWDPEGKNRLQLQLHKSQAPRFVAEKLPIKLVGARSKRDWIAEIAGKRTLLRVDDWILFQNNGSWLKIQDVDTLDAFINGRLKGVLIVLEEPKKELAEPALNGIIFDETRTQKAPLKISLFTSWQGKKASKAKQEEDNEEEDDDDEDDDDDYDDEDEDELEEDDDEDFDDEDEDDEDDSDGLI